MKNIRHTHNHLYKIIEERLGVDVQMRTSIQLESILQRIAGNDVDAFITRLQSQPDTSSEWQQLIQELTIGETYFFRNRTQFDIIKHNILPELLDRYQNTRHLVIWCAGCATGEEAYSLAIMLRENIPQVERWRLTIVATDINAEALKTAKKGIYRDWSFRHNENNYQQKYFTRTDKGYVIVPTIQNMVTFRQTNLFNMPQQAWANLILCRNVLLYFKAEAKARAEQLMNLSLHPGGWLLLGHAEALHSGRKNWLAHMFTGAIAYQKMTPTNTGDIKEQSIIHPASRNDRPSILTTQPLKQLTVDDETHIDEQYQRAVTAYQDEDHLLAEQLLASVVNQSPTSTRARVMLAAVFANRGATTEANIHLNAALKQDALNPDAHYLRAMLYLDKHQDELADHALRAALYSETGHPLAAYTLGNLCAKQGDVIKAHRMWQQAIDAAAKLPPNQAISDFNPRTAADFIALVRSQMSRQS